MKTIASISIVILIRNFLCSENVIAQSFVHPGIDMCQKDLNYMKSQVLKSEQPWKEFARLKDATKLDFEINPFAQVKLRPYAKPNIGVADLSRGASMAYDYALIWYITCEKKLWAYSHSWRINFIRIVNYCVKPYKQMQACLSYAVASNSLTSVKYITQIC